MQEHVKQRHTAIKATDFACMRINDDFNS